MQLRVLLADDEPLARDGLHLLLAADPDVAEIREARNGREAVTAIRQDRPDLVFLDVQMPEVDGFGVLQEVGAERMPEVVLVTAHDQYAIRAFEINAIDYLLKPVTANRFAQALDRAKARLRATPPQEMGRQILSLLETIASPKRPVSRIAVQSAGKIVFIPVEDIDWIQSAENYVQLHTRRSNHLLHVTMAAMEKSLDPQRFLRIHRGAIVNTTRIREIQPGSHGEYTVVLDGGLRLQSGRTYHDRIKSLTLNPF